MQNTRRLEVVFLTNFADYSYRSIPAIAQMADVLAMRLTIVHVLDGRYSACSEADARAQLASFFPEADSYAECERRVMYGDPVSAIERLREDQPVDLVIAPAADPLGLPRIGHRSLRAHLMRRCGVPVWTIGRRSDEARLRAPVRHVACWMDFDGGGTQHFSYALEYAWKLDASLHIFHALPELSEGLLLEGDRPLGESVVIQELRRRIGWSPIPLQFHVAPKPGRRAVARLLDQSCANILFMNDAAPNWGGWFPSKPRLLDEFSCPVICVPTELKTSVWNLEHEKLRVVARR